MKRPLIAGSLMMRCGQTGRCERLCRVKLARLKPPGGMAPERASCGPGAAVPNALPQPTTLIQSAPCFRACATQALVPIARGHRGKEHFPTSRIKTRKNRNAHRLDPILKELQRLECKTNVKSSNMPEHNAFSVSLLNCSRCRVCLPVVFIQTPFQRK